MRSSEAGSQACCAHSVSRDDPGTCVLDQALDCCCDHHITGEPITLRCDEDSCLELLQVSQCRKEPLPLLSGGGP
jgi:hypothetical protein